VIEPMTEAQKLGAVFYDPLSIPSPGEVFAALNKECHPNWLTFGIPVAAPVTTDRNQLALAVGVLVANGYIAVEAQDGQQVKNIGRDILSVAKSLGISKNLMSRGNSLIEFAKNNAWDSLADELEATENEVKRTMVEQKDRSLVSLISAAAWLRGVDVATKIILSDDSLRGIALIRQPELARHLASELEALPERVKKRPLVVQVRQCLDYVAVQLESMGSTPDEERPVLKNIHDKCTQLVSAIFSRSGMATLSSP